VTSRLTEASPRCSRRAAHRPRRGTPCTLCRWGQGVPRDPLSARFGALFVTVDESNTFGLELTEGMRFGKGCISL